MMGNGTTYLNGTYTAGTANYNYDGLAAGTYYVKIFTYYDNGFAPYTLSNTFTAPTQANDVEPDGTVAQAKVLPLNGKKTGHIDYYYNVHRDTIDWYKFTTTGDGLVKLTMASANGQNVYWQLYDNNGTTYINGTYTAGTASYYTDGLAAGTYYVKVFTYYVMALHLIHSVTVYLHPPSPMMRSQTIFLLRQSVSLSIQRLKDTLTITITFSVTPLIGTSLLPRKME